MNILISNSSSKPIYAQIASQIKESIMSNELKENELLPSMRTLAKELRISVITTKRAYEELEKEGFIYSVPGKGSYVSIKNMNIIREDGLRFIEEKMIKIIEKARCCDISYDEMLEMLKILYKGE